MKSIRHPVRQNAAILAAIVVLTLATVVAASYAGADPATSAQLSSPRTRPTAVLVHGADADSSSWQGVVLRLQHAGYPVIAFASPLRGVASDAANLEDLLGTVAGPIVLVGHSYGGMIISVAAAGNHRVKSLVFVDAQIPLPGETAAELTNKFPGSQFGAALVSRPYQRPDGTTGTDLYVDPAKYRELFTGPRVSASDALAFAAEQRPIAQSALTEPATAAAWRTIPSWDVIGMNDIAIPPASQLFMAHRARARITRIPASHASMLAYPGPIAKVIEAAAR